MADAVATTLTVLIVAEHVYILWMEMFAWETVGKKVFGNTLPPHLFRATKGLAANQGLYNGFLAAGLIWSFLIESNEWSINIRLFFLGCIAVAGIFGALSASKRIFFVQALPAVLAILFTIISK